MSVKFTSRLLFIFSIGLFYRTSYAQLSNELGSVHGNFQIDAAYYQRDTIIGADPGSELFRYNAFGNINYQKGGFSAGVRYESYNPPLLGYLPGYKGSGIPYRFARYKHKDIDITVGNFYEQFGSGITLRAYENRGLLYDNALDGMRVIFTPKNGITLKGLVGKQRTYFSLSPGTVRGLDGEINLMELFDSILGKSKTKIILGGSFVSKYQEDQDPTLVLPENVGTSAGRFTVIRGGFNFNAEYAYKINDPSYQNHFSYKEGQAIIASTSYGTDGFSIMFSGKMLDNMSFRSDRNAQNTIDMINYHPDFSKFHTYSLMAYYPYATQPNGEVGGTGEIQYKFKKGTFLGGKYGMDITINGSAYYALDTIGLDPSKDSIRHFQYTTNYGDVGNEYYHDFNIEITKKLSKKLKITAMYANQFLNQSIVQFNTPDKEEHPDITSHIGVLDITWRYKTGSAIRFETQGFFGSYDYKEHAKDAFGKTNITNNTGSWVSELIEWTPTTHWSITLADQYNYNNPEPSKRVHYYFGMLGYTNGPTRISVSYGRQRQGIFCAGGVCRFVPASSGLSISISSSF
ncbi:MAG: hypothetical protein K0S53_1933 [Bacteroidetes bacterium]|jgi:hypothetical protein|nr:hypothetical protein [Bacteroidota bacterium]